eukprot:SAG31_NODE_1326_length_8761_cov_3.896791_2_plen_796_part_00
MTKLGSFRKNWNRRWFVVRADHSLAYYANETDQRPKGEMILQNYQVRTDCQREQKEYCLELYHSRRRCLYVYLETQDEYEEWIPILREACRKSRHVLHPDALRARAFEAAYGTVVRRFEAVEKRPEGSAADALTDLIFNCISDRVLVDVYPDFSKYTSSHEGSLGLKRLGLRASKYVLDKRIGAAVSTAVVASLHRIHEIADEVYQVHRTQWQESPYLWGQFLNTEEELADLVDGALSKIVTPEITRNLRPTTQQVLQVIITSIADAYQMTLAQFNEVAQDATDQLAHGLDHTEAIFRQLNRRIGATVRYRRHPLHGLIDVTDRLREQFDTFLTAQLEEEGILVDNDLIEDAIIDSMQSIMLQAVYALEQNILEHNANTSDLQPIMSDLERLRKQTVDAMHHDCHAAMATLISSVTQSLVVPAYMNRCKKAAAEIVDPQHLCDLTDDLPPLVQHALALSKFVRVRLEAAANQDISLQAVSESVTPLINSRGHGQCVICQAKLKESASMLGQGSVANLLAGDSGATGTASTIPTVAGDDKFPANLGPRKLGPSHHRSQGVIGRLSFEKQPYREPEAEHRESLIAARGYQRHRSDSGSSAVSRRRPSSSKGHTAMHKRAIRRPPAPTLPRYISSAVVDDVSSDSDSGSGSQSGGGGSSLGGGSGTGLSKADHRISISSLSQNGSSSADGFRTRVLASSPNMRRQHRRRGSLGSSGASSNDGTGMALLTRDVSMSRRKMKRMRRHPKGQAPLSVSTVGTSRNPLAIRDNGAGAGGTSSGGSTGSVIGSGESIGSSGSV